MRKKNELIDTIKQIAICEWDEKAGAAFLDNPEEVLTAITDGLWVGFNPDSIRIIPSGRLTPSLKPWLVLLADGRIAEALYERSGNKFVLFTTGLFVYPEKFMDPTLLHPSDFEVAA